jgi:hypothetical protein
VDRIESGWTRFRAVFLVRTKVLDTITLTILLDTNPNTRRRVFFTAQIQDPISTWIDIP